MADKKEEVTSPLKDKEVVITDEDIIRITEEDKKKEIEKEKKNKLEDGIEEIVEDDETKKKIASLFYSNLVDNGLLEENLEFKDLEDVNKLLRKKQEDILEERLKTLPLAVQEEIKARLNGDNFENIKPHVKALDFYSKIDEKKLEEDKDLARELVVELLKRSGDSDDYIKDRITLMEDSDSYLMESKRALKILKEQELNAKNKKIEEEKLERQKAIDSSNKFKDSVSKLLEEDTNLFWGIKPTKAEKDKVILAMFYPDEFKKKYKDLPTFDDIVKQPEVNAQIYLAYIKGMFGKDGKVDFIKNKVKTDYTQEIDSLLNGGKRTGFQRISSEEEKTSLGWFDTISKNLKV